MSTPGQKQVRECRKRAKIQSAAVADPIAFQVHSEEHRTNSAGEVPKGQMPIRRIFFEFHFSIAKFGPNSFVNSSRRPPQFASSVSRESAQCNCLFCLGFRILMIFLNYPPFPLQNECFQNCCEFGVFEHLDLRSK